MAGNYDQPQANILDLVKQIEDVKYMTKAQQQSITGALEGDLGGGLNFQNVQGPDNPWQVRRTWDAEGPMSIWNDPIEGSRFTKRAPENRPRYQSGVSGIREGGDIMNVYSEIMGKPELHNEWRSKMGFSPVQGYVTPSTNMSNLTTQYMDPQPKVSFMDRLMNYLGRR